MADIEALKAKVKTLLELALAELDGDLFTLVIHLEEAVKTAEELEDAIMGPEEDAVEDVLIEPEDVAALIRETFETLKGLDHVDIESLSTWTVTGISLFPRDRLPRLSIVVDEAQRVLVTRAHQIFGSNITRVSLAISVGRKRARRLLQRYGCGMRARHSRGTDHEGDSPQSPSLRLLGQHEQGQ